MTYDAFLSQTIDGGIMAARTDYAEKRQRAKLDGSVAGFESCQGKTPTELRELLATTRHAAEEMFRRVHAGECTDDEYWRARCAELEVEWVCNVISAMLMNEGFETIVPPTVQGVRRAAEILGVRGK